MMLYAIRYIVLICCSLCAMVCAAASNKGKPLSSTMYAQHVQKHPGDSEMYCQWVEALLAEGDTTQAIERITYRLKFNEGDMCMFRCKARIALARGNKTEAVRSMSDAILAGWIPESGDTLLEAIAERYGESLNLRLELLSQRHNTNTGLWHSRASLALAMTDTLHALEYYTTARQLGDTTLNATIAALQPVVATDSSNVRYSVTLTRTVDAYEMQAKCNGLPVKIIVDTTAITNTISGVESMFLLKNEYITQNDIIQDSQVLMRSVEITEQIVLHDVLFFNKNGQEAPIILSLHVFEHLGKPVLNTKNNTIDIYK